jgi:hypothetical protein
MLSTFAGNRDAVRQYALFLQVGPKATANRLTLGRSIALLQQFEGSREIGINVKAIQLSLWHRISTYYNVYTFVKLAAVRFSARTSHRAANDRAKGA